MNLQFKADPKRNLLSRLRGEENRVIVHGQAHKRNEEKKIKQRDDEKTGHLN